MTPPAHAARDEAGFTIIELLIVIVIESLIVGGLGSAFVLIMNNSTTVKESLARTNDARFAANYIVSDARNSSGPETSLTDTTSCPDANPPVAGTPSAVARFDWISTSSTGATTADIVNYVLVSNALLRRECHNGTLVNDDALATKIASATVSCSPTADCSGTPTTITAAITETQGSSSVAAYQYSLTGAFRKVLAVGAPLSNPSTPPYPLLALGQSCAAAYTGVKMSGTSTIHVQGDAYLNVANSGNCHSLDLAGSAAFTADHTKILTGGTCNAGGTAVCPTVTAYSPAVTDPYASLTAPSTAGLPSQSGCAGGTAQPGVYASALSLTGSATCNLASGVYILQGGLSTANTSVLTNDAAGVLIYITGGSISFGGNSTVTLSAMTSGTYAGMAIWQAPADTTTLTIGNGISPVITGAVYAPGAQLTISGSSQPTMTALVMKNLLIQGSAAPVIGTALSITNPSLPAWTAGYAYPSTTLTPAGGEGTYSWSASGLPTGLSINASTGVISGTTNVTGAASVTITLNDSFGDPAGTQLYTLTINTAPSITSTSPLPAWGQGIAYTTTVAESGGTAPFNWTASGLPSGLSINSSTGVISGTPGSAGTTSATVTLTDHAGATVNKSLSITITTAAIITSVVLSNGGATPGKLQAGDTIVITFSATMSVSSFCSAWSGNGSNQTLNANNDVNVALTNGTGATNDTLTVTSASCSSNNFGTFNLGSPSYVSSVVSFGGSGANVSTIAWNAAAHTLTVTLGAQKSGTVLTVASSAPVYTASGSVLDGSGAAIGNSPFTLPNVQQF